RQVPPGRGGPGLARPRPDPPAARASPDGRRRGVDARRDRPRGRGARRGGHRGGQGVPAPRPGVARDRAVVRRRLVLAAMPYREAVGCAIAQELDRDPPVSFIGEDVAAAGGVFKTTEGLYERFGPKRVRDTPISEQAIIGAVMGAAMNGLKPVAEIMFSDFF